MPYGTVFGVGVAARMVIGCSCRLATPIYDNHTSSDNDNQAIILRFNLIRIFLINLNFTTSIIYD